MKDRIRFPRARARAATLLLAAAFLPGCASTYLVSSAFEPGALAGDKPAEIVVTPVYEAKAGTIRTVALSAPDECATVTTSETSGKSVHQESLLRTRCGIQMAEIEKAMVRYGYKVISWKTMYQRMGSENKSSTVLARELGADVLFQVNALDQNQKFINEGGTWQRSYFKSNGRYDNKGPAVLNSYTAGLINDTMKRKYEQRLRNYPLPVAGLDITVTDTATEESIWFYRNEITAALPARLTSVADIVFYCDGSFCYDWGSKKDLEARRQAPAAAASSTSEQVEGENLSENERTQVLRELMGVLVKDMVKQFSRDLPVPPAPPAPPPAPAPEPVAAAPAAAPAALPLPAETPAPAPAPAAGTRPR